MNYTTITINNDTISLRFGMASFRYLQGKLVQGKTFENNELNEIGISHILYSGYYNNCIVNEIDVKYTFADFVDWIESNLTNDDVKSDIRKAMEIWASNEIVKKNKPLDQQGSKKKNSRGMK